MSTSTTPPPRSKARTGTRSSPPWSASIGKHREAISFYISSTMVPADAFAQAIRGHWGVENKNHWVRDVTMTEDASRIRIHPGIMARLRSQALNIARANGVMNIAAALWQGAINPKLTLSYTGPQRA